MTTYTFTAKPTTQFVNWSDPSVWVGGVFPNSPDADVVFPTITMSGGNIYSSFVTIANSESFSVNSVSITNNFLVIHGSLSANDLAVLTSGEIDTYLGSTLSVGSLENGGDIQGSGQIQVSGLLSNIGGIAGGVSVTAAGLNNIGQIHAASGTLTVTVSSGGFTNLSGSTLTGGTYSAGGGSIPSTLDLNVGSLIVSDAANIAMDAGGAIASFDPNSSTYVPLQSSLGSIAHSGTLSLANQTYNWGSLTDDGVLTLSASNNASTVTLNASQLIVNSDGEVVGIGTIMAPIVNAGLILAGEQLFSGNNDVLVIDGTITGSGTLQITHELGESIGTRFQTLEHATLELNGAVSNDVVFSDGTGMLVLDTPTSFTGAITPAGPGDAITLPGVSLSSVTGYSYTGDSHGGTLSLQEAGTTLNLDFSGNFSTASFSLSAGPQALSSSPPSLVITIVDRWHVVGTGDFNGDSHGDILWQDDKGQAGVWLMNGTTATAQTNVGANFGPTWHVIGSGDFNGDGKSDFLWQNDDGQAGVWLMSGTTPIAQTTVGANFGPTWHVIGAGDFDGDHKSDILWQNNDGQAGVWLMNGAAPVAQTTVGANFGPAWHVIGSGDFNGDGKADILWQNDNGQAGIWLMNGTTPIAQTTVGDNFGPTWHVIGSGDFNGDGKADILWQNDNGQAGIWLMNGTTPIAQTTVGDNFGPAWHVIGAGDFNGDGKADVLWQNDNGQAGVWLMNGTTPIAQTEVGINPDLLLH
jgi:hypothetical protein